MTLRTLFTTLAMALCLPALAAPAQPQTNLQRDTLQVKQHTITVQLAQTAQQRQIGLMHRRHMPANEGMLFVFEQPGVQCFWMKNTRLPLTAAFVADDGTIVNLADMQPMSTTNHCSAQPVRYVLEMNQGWFRKHRVLPGDRITRKHAKD